MLLHRDESNSDESPRRINDISPSDDKKKSKRKWVSKSNFLFKFSYWIIYQCIKSLKNSMVENEITS